MAKKIKTEQSEEIVNTKDKALSTPEEMKPTGEKTGKTAKFSFQYNGIHYKSGDEILGLSAAQLKEVSEKGLVE